MVWCVVSRRCPGGVPAVSRWCPSVFPVVSQWCPGAQPGLSRTQPKCPRRTQSDSLRRTLDICRTLFSNEMSSLLTDKQPRHAKEHRAEHRESAPGRRPGRMAGKVPGTLPGMSPRKLPSKLPGTFLGRVISKLPGVSPGIGKASWKSSRNASRKASREPAWNSVDKRGMSGWKDLVYLSERLRRATSKVMISLREVRGLRNHRNNSSDLTAGKYSVICYVLTTHYRAMSRIRG